MSGGDRRTTRRGAGDGARAPRRRRRADRRGFTLVEVAVAVGVVGVGITALLVAAASTTRVNDASRKLTQAALFVQEAREWTLSLPFSDPDAGDAGNPPGPDGSDPQDFVDDLDDLLGYEGTGTTYCPPRDGQGYAISAAADWSQQFTLDWRNPEDLSESVADGGSDVVYVDVTVARHGKAVMTCGWLITRSADE
ncbi:MAG: prepilin-type N-terminal cleavage/methylation domain-containing protein [Planctomycetota bacterium]